MLQKNKLITSIVGPAGSNLFALVKIRNSGLGDYYRRQANKEIYLNSTLQEQIRENFLKIDEEFIVNIKRNPFFVKADRTILQLDWHHSPNHIMSLSLISRKIHQSFRKELHIDGYRGGNEMYNTQYLKK